MPDEGASWGDGHLPIALCSKVYTQLCDAGPGPQQGTISALPPLLLGSASRGR